jgi:arylsulfatase A-like enzyme
MLLTKRGLLARGLIGGLLIWAVGIPGAGSQLSAASADGAKTKYNVLFIGVDDLRPALGCYGDPVAKTPHLDALAARGTVFRRAYCQLPSCLPSRTSLLTGLRPDTVGVLTNRDDNFRQRRPDHVTLPQHFKNHGAFCMSFGKIFHRQDPISWSVEKWIPLGNPFYPIYGKPETLALQREKGSGPKKPSDWWGFQEGRNTRWAKAIAWEDPDVPDHVLFDGQLADRVIEVLRQHRDDRFFLAPGFFRPHLPFVAPKKYFDMYPPERLRLPENRDLPEGAPSFAHHDSAESRSYLDIPKKGEPISEAKQLELLRGYYASVSYVDAQIGRVLDELGRLGLADSTVIMVWSDHGYHFGEHGTWNKLTNFEESTRSTLIASVPDQPHPGVATDALVEHVDMYPTLCELCGLPAPEGLEGVSFAALLKDPGRRWKRAAFSQANPRGRLGRTMRTDRYRYTEWSQGGQVVAVEVYDHETDPGENVNIGAKPENRDLVGQLAEQFRAGWRGAAPPRPALGSHGPRRATVKGRRR